MVTQKIVEAREALLAWVTEAADYIDAHADELDWNYYPGRWEVDSTSDAATIIAHPTTTTSLTLTPELAASLAALPTWSDARSALNDALDGRARPPFTFGEWDDEMGAAFHCIPISPRVGASGEHTIAVRRERLASRVESMLNFCGLDKRSVTRHVLGLSAPNTYVELEEGVVLRSLSSEDLAWALNLQIITKRDTVRFAHAPSQYQFCSLEIVGDEAWGDGRTTAVDETLTQCLVLSGAPEFRALGHFSTLNLDLPLGGSMSLPIAPRALEEWSPQWSADAIDRFQKTWTLLRSAKIPSSISLALRRIGRTARRSTAEDNIVDLMIAAEAIYLSDSGSPEDRSELSYRLSQRAAVWSQAASDVEARLRVQKFMRAAYRARSRVVHGGTLKESHFPKGLTPDKIRPYEEELVELLSAACLRALRDSWPPNWDELVLG